MDNSSRANFVCRQYWQMRLIPLGNCIQLQTINWIFLLFLRLCVCLFRDGIPSMRQLDSMGCSLLRKHLQVAFFVATGNSHEFEFHTMQALPLNNKGTRKTLMFLNKCFQWKQISRNFSQMSIRTQFGEWIFFIFFPPYTFFFSDQSRQEQECRAKENIASNGTIFRKTLSQYLEYSEITKTLKMSFAMCPSPLAFVEKSPGQKCIEISQMKTSLKSLDHFQGPKKAWYSKKGDQMKQDLSLI